MISSPIKFRRSARVAGRSAARYLVIRPSFPLLAGYQSECHCCSTFKASTTPASVSPLPVAPSQQHIRASPFPEASCNALGSRPSVKPAPGFPSRTLEEQLWAKGFKHVAGMLELCGNCPLYHAQRLQALRQALSSVGLLVPVMLIQCQFSDC